MIYEIIMNIIAMQQTLDKVFTKDEVFAFLTVRLAFVFFLLFLYYIFKGIGLAIMAKKAKIKIWFFAFIPFLSTYLAGKLIDDGAKIFGWKIKNIGLVTMLFQIISFISLISIDVLICLEPLKALYNGTTSSIIASDIGFANMFESSLFVVNYILELVLLFFEIILFMNLYRTYNPQRAGMFAMIAILVEVFTGVGFMFGIFVFALRNNDKVNYQEFLKAKYAEYERRFGNPNMPNNPYNNPNFNNQAPKEPDDPFEEFSDKKTKFNPRDDVFSDFSSNKNNGNNNKDDDSGDLFN